MDRRRARRSVVTPCNPCKAFGSSYTRDREQLRLQRSSKTMTPAYNVKMRWPFVFELLSTPIAGEQTHAVAGGTGKGKAGIELHNKPYAGLSVALSGPSTTA